MPADERNRIARGPVAPRIQLGQLMTPMEIASAIHNFRITRENSLRSVAGPTPYLPKYKNQDATWSSARKYVRDYTTMHGIFHAVVGNGQREVLLLHVGKELWVFEGWNKSWRPLISASSSYAQIRVALHDDDRARAPTQFVSTPNGIVIIPQAEQDRRPYFYDGEVILPLGYAEIPGTPSPIGPKNPAIFDNSRAANSKGYSVTQDLMNRSRMRPEFYHGKYGSAKIGSISIIPDVDPDKKESTETALGCPYLLNGEWSCASQWVDYFGNLSPISPVSQSLRLFRRPVKFNEDKKPEPGETLQHQFIWSNIDRGPTGTIGRNLYRTKDVLNAGTAKLYRMPSTSVGRSTNRSVELSVSAQFATIPENTTKVFPDNVPDSALVAEARDIVPVPKFRVAQLAMGRLFIGNLDLDPGAIMYSIPGRWGTFEREAILFPDPSGGVITGLWKISGGVLAFTESSTYAVVPADDGIGLKSYPISSTVGCSSPRSIAEMPSGLIIWLTEDGFYGFDGKEVVPLFNGLEEEVAIFNRPRLVQATSTIDYDSKEYICWLPTKDGILNNRGYVFDGNGWKVRTGAKYVDLCTTRDHRKYVIGCGQVYGTYSNFDKEDMTVPGVFGDDGESGGSSSDNWWDKDYKKEDSSSSSSKPNPSGGGGGNPTGSGSGGSSSGDLSYKIKDFDPSLESVIRGSLGYTTSIDSDGTSVLVRKRPTDQDNSNWGVWVLDHESRNFYPDPRFREPIFETSWIGAGEQNRKTALTLTVWFRETSASQQVKVRVYRDWRKDTQVHEVLLDLDSPEDPSPAWGQVNSEDNEKWSKRRPYWIRKDIYIPSCEVFKLYFEGMIQTETVDTQINPETLGTGSVEKRQYDSVSDIEIVAIRVEESPRSGSARVPRSN